MNSNPHQVSLLSSHFSPSFSSRVAKFSEGEVRTPVNPVVQKLTKHFTPPSKQCSRPEEKKLPCDERNKSIANRVATYNPLPQSAEPLKNYSEKDRPQSRSTVDQNECNTLQKQSSETSDGTNSVEKRDRTAVLIKAKRKSLHDMRLLQNNVTIEESSKDRDFMEKNTIHEEEEETKPQAVPFDNNTTAETEMETSFPNDLGNEPSSYLPSFTDQVLQWVGLTEETDKTVSKDSEEISLMETEEKFASLALAFRTDRHTLDKRIELHLRARDVSEENIGKELESLKDEITVLSQLYSNCQSTQQIFSKIHSHLKVLEQSISRMSSRAEDHGAVQQELRVSQAIEAMVQHVENLKRVYKTEHNELQEARKAMSISKSDSTDSTGGNRAVDRPSYGAVATGRGSLRRVSLALMSKNPRPSRTKSLQSFQDGLVPATGSSSSVSPPSFFSDEKINQDSCGEETAAGLSEKNCLNRKSSIVMMAKSIQSTLRNSITDTIDGRHSNFESKLMRNIQRTSKECLSNVDEDITVKKMGDLICQRHSIWNYLAWLTPLLHTFVPSSSKTAEETGRLSFLFGAFSKFPPIKTFFGYVVVLMLISLGFFLIIYHWWMVSEYF